MRLCCHGGKKSTAVTTTVENAQSTRTAACVSLRNMPASNPDVRSASLSREIVGRAASGRERFAMRIGLRGTDTRLARAKSRDVCAPLSDRSMQNSLQHRASADRPIVQPTENTALVSASKSTRQCLPSRIGCNSLKTISRALAYSTIFRAPCRAPISALRSHSQHSKLLRGLPPNDVIFRVRPHKEPTP